MKMKTLTTMSLLAIAALSAACTPKASLRPDGRPGDHLTPTERLLVSRAPATQPLKLVTNDVPAGDVFLHTASLSVDPRDPALGHLQARMQATVDLEKGVGIAAPQVGVNRRFILVKRLDKKDEPFHSYSNPSITRSSEATEVAWEGCLSIPAGFGQVRRAQSITLRHQDQDGRWLTEEVKGFTARIFQHEIDHLDGVLFIERKEPGELIPKDEYRRRKEEQKQRPTSESEKAPKT